MNANDSDPNVPCEQSIDINEWNVAPNMPEIQCFTNFKLKQKIPIKNQYYTICTINCPTKPEFVNAIEKTLLSIEDEDNPDYWTFTKDNKSSLIVVVPRCCLSTLSGEVLMSSIYGKKRNPREAFREDILQISNKNQESLMKRKYVVVDMIESDREYSASLKRIIDILSTLDCSGNQFTDKLISQLGNMQEILSSLLIIHERQILPKLSVCALSPTDVAIVLMEEKENLKLYSKLSVLWKIIKYELDKLVDKHISLSNNLNYDNSKVSMLSFIDLMTNVDQQLFRYSTFLCDILIYTGRVAGDIYNIQKAITMLNKIQRRNYEDDFIMSLLEDKNCLMKNERIIRMTSDVLVSQVEMVTRNGKMQKPFYSKPFDMILLKTKLFIIDKHLTGINNQQIIDINKIKIFETQCLDNELILWYEMSDGIYEIFIFSFQLLINKTSWIFDIQRRLAKLGKSDIYVSSQDFNNHYKQFVLKNQRFTSLAMESVPMDSSVIDDSSHLLNSELYEEMTSSIDSSSDANYESAIMDTPSPLTSTSYNTARDKLKTSTDKATRPISGISQDSISTLDGVRTPFEDEDVARKVSIVSEVSNIELDKTKDLSWSLTFQNLDRHCQSIVWSIGSKSIDPKDPSVSIKMSEDNNNRHQCQFIKKNSSITEMGPLTCKIVDLINGSLLASSTVTLSIPLPLIEIELDSKLTELTVKENEQIDITLKVTKGCLTNINTSHIAWSKDNEKIKIDNHRFKCVYDDKAGTIGLCILKANNSDAGIYTIESSNSNKLLIKNSSNISILVLIEMVKKTVLRTASQEDSILFEHTHVNEMSPFKDGQSVIIFSNEQILDDDHHSVITTTRANEVRSPILKLISSKLEVDELEKATLEVEILGKILESPKWFFNNTLVQGNDLITIGYRSGENRAILIINKCERAHNGKYKCSVANQENGFEESITIDLNVVEKKTKSLIECNIQEIDLKSEETLMIEMRTVGIEELVLKTGNWYLNDKILEWPKLNGEFIVSKSLVSLKIPNISKSLKGVLVFKITEPLVICSPEVEIKIRETEKKITKSSKADLKLNVTKPVLEVLQGKEILLEIDIVAGYVAMYQPPKWTLNNEVISNKSCKTTLAAKRCKLSIVSCKIIDAGVYKCTFCQGKGNNSEPVSAEFTVTVKDPKKITTDTKKKEITRNIIKIGSLLIEVEEFNEAVLKVDIMGPIKEDPGWYFNNKLLTNNDNVNIIYKSDSNICQLIIKKCAKVHEGDYVCKVINTENQAEESVKMSLKVVQKQITQFLECDIQEIDLKCDEILKLEMKAGGIEESVLQSGCWYLNSKILDLKSLKGESIVSSNLLTLRIPSVTKAIQGNLQYKISSPDIICSSGIDIKIRESGKIPIQATKDILILKEKKSNIEVIENEDLLIEIEILSGNLAIYQPPTLTLNDVPLNETVKVTLDKKLCKLLILSCQLCDSGTYKFTFKPLNPKITDSVTASVLVIVAEIPRKMNVTNSIVEVSVSESVTLCVETNGFQEKDIKWLVFETNDQAVSKTLSCHATQKFSDNLALLLIDNIKKEDAGVYFCKGFNKAELRAEAVITLIVHERDKSVTKCSSKFENDVYIVTEGCDINMKVIIVSSSDPKLIVWSLNSNILEMGTDILSLFIEHESTVELIIRQCSRDKAGLYQCAIDFKDGSTSKSVTSLQVLDVIEHKTVIVLEGNKLTIELSLDKVSKECVFQLSKDEVILDDSLGFTQIKDKELVCFYKELSTQKDAGHYIICAFLDSVIEKKVDILVVVETKQVCEFVDKIKLICDDNEILANEKEPLIISVEVDKWQVASVQWFLNGKAYGVPHELDSQFIDLYIDSPKSKIHSGIFKCEVTNINKCISSVEILVKFEDIKKRDNENIELLSCTVEEVNLIEGEQLQLSVQSKESTESLPTTPVWYKDGHVLDITDARTTIIVQPFNVNLVLNNTKLIDSGNYCLSIGGQSVEIIVRVRSKPAIVPIQDVFASLQSPKTKLKMKEITLKSEPHSVKFEFEIEQCGPTKAVWYFEDELIELDDSQFIQWSCDNFFALTIPMASKKHCGRYTIKVANEMGYVKDEAKLCLMEKARIAPCVPETPGYIEDSCCIAPVFTKKLKSMNLSPGDILRLSCRVMSEPEPKILWTKDGESLDPKNSNRKMKVLNNFPNYDLTISDITNKDIGQYCCMASNFRGFDRTNAMITVDGLDFDDTEDLSSRVDTLRVVSTPLNVPILKILSSNSNEVAIVWTEVLTTDCSKVTYAIEKQKFNKSNQWKTLLKNLLQTSCSIATTELPLTELHYLRCVGTTEFGLQAASNVVCIDVRTRPPTIPVSKPTIHFRDASCVTITWQRGKCHGMTSEESFGKIFYSLEMKDNTKGNWEIVENKLLKSEYSMALEPGVSYMFQVRAFNDNGTSEPTPSVITRIDLVKLAPDFSLDPPWLHIQAQPCLKWRAALVPEFCENCVHGILPEYIIECRGGRSQPWQIFKDNITQCQIFLSPEFMKQTKEVRVSCRNRFGQNGPTKTFRLPTKLSGKPEEDLQNGLKSSNIINNVSTKKAEFESICPGGLSVKWDPWCDKSNRRYTIQKRVPYSSEWMTLEPLIYGEDCFLDLQLTENYSRELRILAIETDGCHLLNGYNLLTIPLKEQLVPTMPSDLRVSAKLSIHDLTWNPSKNYDLVDVPITYVVQYKTTNNHWITACESLQKCCLTNEKIGDISVIYYRVFAVNAFGSSPCSTEVQVNTPLNSLLNEQIIKSIRHFVIDFERMDLKWQVSDAVFDGGLNIDDLSFTVEQRSSTELSSWHTVGRCSGRCSVLIKLTFGEENLYRVQPFIHGEKMSPSRIVRIYLSNDLLVPDMSLIKPDIISDSLTDYFIEWVEPSIECGFSPEAINMCSFTVLTTDLQYELQCNVEPSTIQRKETFTSKWTKVEDNITENMIYWENPDPTREYSFRLVPSNQFGVGQSSRVIKLRPQITIPDFSLVPLNIDIQIVDVKTLENDVSLYWVSPRINPDRYTPYSIDLQYRKKGCASDEQWVTLKSSTKKSRISINELDPTIDYELRIVPVTEFGSGNPSIIVRRPKLHDQDRSTTIPTTNSYLSNQISCTEVYECLGHDAELTFRKLSNIDQEDILLVKGDNPLELHDDRLKIEFPDSHSACLLISKITETDFGTYKLYSKNNDVLLDTITVIKADAPTFLNPPLNRSVNLHDNVQITFKIDSKPTPTVTWSKNWKKLYSNYRATITEDVKNQRYSMILSKCILSDSGEYNVRAENIVGSVDVKFNLKVEDQPESKLIQINEGDIYDRYFISKQISRGAYSTCQLVVEKSTHSEFVGKVFLLNDVEIGRNEFESMKNIRQRNIVELIDAGLSMSELLVLVYESFEGALLVDYISNLNLWNEQQVQLIIYQLFQATCYLHSKGIGHLDIQPCNVFITGKLYDTVKLFGFSNATKEPEFETRRNQLTMCPFSAPELLKGEQISFKCDVWSLGVLSLICLQGHLNMDLISGPLDMDIGKGLLTKEAWNFVARCLNVDSQRRLCSHEALTHAWFTNTVIDYNASLDHLKDDIVKLMTYPEEMVLNFSPDMQIAIKNSLLVPKPKLMVDSIQSSPSISQLSSRASSVSKDGINYERCDMNNGAVSDARIVDAESKESIQSVDDTYVPNSAKELLFTVPLKDQTFRPSSLADSTNVVNLTCQLALSASDAISISWYKGQELLTDGSKIKLEVLSDGFLSCTIANPGESDVGIYRCVARSRSLRAESSARLLIGDVPTQPSQPSMLFVNENDVLLTWSTDLSATSDIIYRVDFAEINHTEDNANWKVIGYTVDNRYLMEDFSNGPCVIRVVAQNKYGFSSYSIASSAFQNKSSNDNSSNSKTIINKQWMCSSRQSQDSNSLHDLIKDIPPNEITLDVIKEYYTNLNTEEKNVNLLVLNQSKRSYPDCIVQRKLELTEKYPAIELSIRMKYYHLPIIYGAINDPSIGLRYTIEEFVPGGDLISVMLAREWYSEFTVVTILRQLIETVQFLHSNNIVHTNINPSNILIARRTNQLYDIKLIGLQHCQSVGVCVNSLLWPHKVASKLSTFQAPEFRYEGVSKNETDIWSIGTLAFLLLETQLPTIEDVCSDCDVQCSIKNTNRLNLPSMHTHFRCPDLSGMSRFSKSARKFIYNSLKKNPSERGSADYWLAHLWFRQDLSTIDEMQKRQIRAAPLVEFISL